MQPLSWNSCQYFSSCFCWKMFHDDINKFLIVYYGKIIHWLVSSYVRMRFKKYFFVFPNREAIFIHFSVKDPICWTLVPWKLVCYSLAMYNFWDYFHFLIFLTNHFLFFLSGLSFTNIHDSLDNKGRSRLSLPPPPVSDILIDIN